MEIEFEIESLCPLKMDKWQEGKQPKSDTEYKKQAELKLYTNEKGFVSIPSCSVKASMRMASSEIGKRTDAKKNRQTIKSMVFIEPEFLSLNRKDHDGIVSDVATRGQGEKVTRVKIYRPLIKKWKCTGIINTQATPDFLYECLQLAGMRYGLLSHRPEFGRFKITKWRVINNGAKK